MQLIDSSFFQVGVLIYSFVCKVKQIGQGRDGIVSRFFRGVFMKIPWWSSAISL